MMVVMNGSFVPAISRGKVFVLIPETVLKIILFVMGGKTVEMEVMNCSVTESSGQQLILFLLPAGALLQKQQAMQYILITRMLLITLLQIVNLLQMS